MQGSHFQSDVAPLETIFSAAKQVQAIADVAMQIPSFFNLICDLTNALFGPPLLHDHTHSYTELPPTHIIFD